MKSYFVFLVLMLSMAGDLAAQKEATLTLRNGDEVDGVLVAVTSDSLYLTQPQLVHYADRAEGVPTLSYSRREVETVSYGGGPGVLQTTLYGTGAGLVISGVAAFTMKGEDDALSQGLMPMFRAIVMIIGTASGAVAGLLYGLLSGDSATEFDMSDDSDYEMLRAAYQGIAGSGG